MNNLAQFDSVTYAEPAWFEGGRRAALHVAVVASIRRFGRQTVVSTNRVMGAVQGLCPDSGATEAELVLLVREYALLLGFVPVYDPHARNDNHACNALPA